VNKMSETDLKKTIEKHFDAEETKEFVIKALKTPHCNTRYWEREPKLHYFIQRVIQPLFDEVGLNTWIDDCGHLLIKMGKGKTGRKSLNIQHTMAWGAAEDEAEYNEASPLHKTGEVVDAKDIGIEGFNPKEHGVEGKVVWGRDGGECVGSLIAAAEAARILARSGLEIPGEHTFIITAGGHQGSSGNIFHVIHNDEIKADMAVHSGPTTILYAGLGRIDLRITVEGKVSHSSFYNPENSLNAIDGAYIVLNRLQKLMPFPPGPKDPIVGVGPKLIPIGIESYPKPPTFSWGLGSAGHTRQGVVKIAFDRRILNGESVDDAVKQIENAIGDISPFRYKIERGAYHFPWNVPKDAPVVKAISNSYKQMLEKEAKPTYGTAAWDMGAVNRLGIPCVMYGAIGPFLDKPPIGCHCKEDLTVLNWVNDVAKVYAHFAVTSTK
jgi:acetylornithine deacetylase/succinyl-diaminopimelate desuccinylase-like protein